ncbi:MAG: thiamine ABC transporter substrate-binding protein [Litorilinea sp.]
MIQIYVGQTKRTPRALIMLWMVLGALLTGACAPVQPSQIETGSEPATLTIASHSSFNISEQIILDFEAERNVELQFLDLGDAGEALNTLILSRDAPLADIFFGVDNTFLSRALNADIFQPYASPLLAEIPDELELDPDHTLLPVDYGFVNINADAEWFAVQNLSLPTTLNDLTRPEFAGLLVLPNPATSSPGLAFLLTTIAYFGEDGYLDFWQALRDNDALITDGWSEAYYDHFTVGSGGTGDRPLVVSYSTSPPADVIFAADGRTEPASVNISPPGGTFRQIEFVGILKSTEQPELAQALVDAMLSVPFQEDIPLQMFVYPANVNAELPSVFVEFGQTPAQPAELPYADIEANRERWINAWTDIMLR